VSKCRILFLDDFEGGFAHSPAILALSSRADLVFHSKSLRGDALADALSQADGLVLMRDRTPFGEPELTLAPRLKFLIYTGTRNNLLDEAACAARGIPVLNTEFGPSKASTCELTWALVLAAVKRFEQGLTVMRSNQLDWRHGLQYPALPDVLESETFGLIGLGQIGTRVARVAQAFGMKTIAWSPNLTHERAESAGSSLVPLERVLSEAKVVSLHLVLAPSTKGLMNRETLALMRNDSVLVNTSRSGLVVEGELVAALNRGRPAAAALDVFDEEPLSADHPFRSMPQVTLTPHLGFVSNPVYRVFTETVATHLSRLLPLNS